MPCRVYMPIFRQSALKGRFYSDAGIAIGPILFIIAILAILATAIAAGSGTFASNSSQETNRTNAAEMIQIGQSLKLGVDRVVSLGNPLNAVDINTQNTTQNNSIFSPLGGGLIPPSTALANNSASDLWIYSWADVANLGAAAVSGVNTGWDRIALLKVTKGVCDQINTQTNNPLVDNSASPPTSGNGVVDLGAVSNTTNATIATWPASHASKLVGCIYNTDTGAGIAGYYFYQVLGVQ